MHPPIVTLTTDFGQQDHYVGTMKGVILGRCPGATIVDISHGLPAFSIEAAAYTIDQAAPFFPDGTVHVIVVDPGVGTSRKAVVAKAFGQYFVAPDNGVLSLILGRDPRAELFEITNPAMRLEAISATFHGRDLFAPAGASLAAGTVSFREAGPKVEGPVVLKNLDPQRLSESCWQGIAISIDKFGNIITNFKRRDFQSVFARPFILSAGHEQVREVRETFGAAEDNLCFAYAGSSGFMEIGVNRASAADRTGLRIGDAILLETTT
jgi:S-adenosyl-L-methionine hydrolase (adenosine-forming)